jgi:hypothetical protein
MKAMSKSELELEKLISKLEGQLASAHYALNLMRSKVAEMPQRNAKPVSDFPEPDIAEFRELQPANGIPLFS